MNSDSAHTSVCAGHTQTNKAVMWHVFCALLLFLYPCYSAVDLILLLLLFFWCASTVWTIFEFLWRSSHMRPYVVTLLFSSSVPYSIFIIFPRSLHFIIKCENAISVSIRLVRIYFLNAQYFCKVLVTIFEGELVGLTNVV